MRKYLVLSLVAVLAVTGSAFAGTASRMQGKILDAATKAPIANATLNLEAVESKTIKLNVPVKPDGSFAVFVLDGTIRYKFTVAAPGYASYVETIKMKLDESELRDFELVKAGAGSKAARAADPTVDLYNDGAALANAGDLEGAIAKFEAAVAIKPDMLATWSALAKTYLRARNYPKAIEAAGKVLEIDATDNDMLAIQYEGYTQTGDKAAAAAVEARLPKDANGTFNDAARLINSGDDAGAEKLLQQAIALDEKFAKAHYELGMIYVRAGKSAEAKAELEKYIELDPNGKDAATAKEMMSYLK
jgi:tetratricopeptide (TPR) repeat protein